MPKRWESTDREPSRSILPPLCTPQNIDAGGKKSKKKEGEKEPKPFVCAIYRRDIASFLPREKIQQWRLTSSHSNASLIEFPSRLPRFKYDWLTVIFVSICLARVPCLSCSSVGSPFRRGLIDASSRRMASSTSRAADRCGERSSTRSTSSASAAAT